MKQLDLTDAKNVLSDWFGVTLPDHVLEEIIVSDTHLLYEVETGGIGDTEERSDLMRAILKRIGMRDWPLNGEGRAVFEEFIKELEVKIQTIGGKLG